MTAEDAKSGMKFSSLTLLTLCALWFGSAFYAHHAAWNAFGLSAALLLMILNITFRLRNSK
jgi:hypothetical protein